MTFIPTLLVSLAVPLSFWMQSINNGLPFGADAEEKVPVPYSPHSAMHTCYRCSSFLACGGRVLTSALLLRLPGKTADHLVRQHDPGQAHYGPDPYRSLLRCHFGCDLLTKCALLPGEQVESRGLGSRLGLAFGLSLRGHGICLDRILTVQYKLLSNTRKPLKWRTVRLIRTVTGKALAYSARWSLTVEFVLSSVTKP